MFDKLIKRITSWTAKNLSYGGKVQLIKSILFAMCMYGSAFYFLLRKVINDIEMILKTFLWGSSKKAKVKWSSICQPNESGGFGFTDLFLVSSAYLINIILNIYANKENLLIKWVHTVILLGRLSGK